MRVYLVERRNPVTGRWQVVRAAQPAPTRLAASWEAAYWRQQAPQDRLRVRVYVPEPGQR